MSDQSWRTELHAAFAKFDQDGSGAIDKGEFNALLDALGSDMSATDRELGFALVDKDEDGSVTLGELEEWWDIVRAESDA